MSAHRPPLRSERVADGALLCLVLDKPPGNVLDSEMVAALSAAVGSIAADRTVRAILLEAEGPNFCFGASVEEHLPDKVADMLRAFHGLFETLLDGGRPLIAAVRGHCLGGGLELAAFAQRLFATPDATLGQPEIRLGVFAPAGSLILPRRVGQAAADHLLLSGATVGGREALALGLVDELADDPGAAARAYAEKRLADKSGASLSLAARAARHEYARAVRAGLRELERLYLDELMAGRDGEEGIRAFLEKRKPTWSHA